MGETSAGYGCGIVQRYTHTADYLTVAGCARVDTTTSTQEVDDRHGRVVLELGRITNNAGNLIDGESLE